MDQQYPLPLLRIIGAYLQVNLKPSKIKSRQLFLTGGFNLRNERESNPSVSDVISIRLELVAPVQTSENENLQGSPHHELYQTDPNKSNKKSPYLKGFPPISILSG